MNIVDRFLVPSSLYKKKFNKRQGEKIGVNGAGIFWSREPKEIKELIGCHKLQPVKTPININYLPTII